MDDALSYIITMYFACIEEVTNKLLLCTPLFNTHSIAQLFTLFSFSPRSSFSS